MTVSEQGAEDREGGDQPAARLRRLVWNVEARAVGAAGAGAVTLVMACTEHGPVPVVVITAG
jgi:hypothetical protein